MRQSQYHSKQGTDFSITWQELISTNHFDNPKIVKNKVSEYIMGQQNKTLAHVIRTDKQNPMRRMTLSDVMETPFEEKLTTVFHELYHISPMFDGDIRRLEGRYHVHSHSQYNCIPINQYLIL